MAEIYFDDDADLGLLKDKVIGVIGYGNQGRAQAWNLRDSGLQVLVGNREDDYAAAARRDGFQVLSVAEAAGRAHVLLLLIPDEILPAVFAQEIGPQLSPDKVLVFASGYNIYYRQVEPPPYVDVVLVAPRMIGKGVREGFLSGKGFPSLIAVHQDHSGQALPITLAIAKGIGSTKGGAVMSSFAEETICDLFNEHFGYLYSIRRAYEVLREAGCSPEAILLEFYASGEEMELARAHYEIGLWHQLPLHSQTSQYGQEVTARLSPEEEEQERARLRRIVENITSGRFAKEWTLEQQAGYPMWKRLRAQNLEHPMIVEERKLYRRLGRIPPEGEAAGSG
jgi:ketol-acid reductoisomerase